MKISFFFTLVLLLASTHSWSQDYEVSSWRCGAPLVEALRRKDPKDLLDDRRGHLKLQESLTKISNSNLKYLENSVGSLDVKEQALYDLILNKYQAPLVHRTSNDTTKFVLTGSGLVSATKRKAAANTPKIEQELFSGWDCIFVSIGIPYGTERYGNAIVKLKQDKLFGWATLWSGYHWIKTGIAQDLTKTPSNEIKAKFAEQIYVNEHWDKVMALQIIGNIRKGGSYRGQGDKYDKATIMDDLLARTTSNSFWSKIDRHRLAYLEGKYIDNVSLSDVQFIQYRKMDEALINSWGLPGSYFLGGDEALLQFYNRKI